MKHQEVYAAISAEIRGGHLASDALDKLNAAFERDEVSSEEEEYLREILENN